MSGLRPFTQHPDRLRDPHEQARRLASDALREPLGDLDAAWLDDHLATCQPCATEVEGFVADASLLRDLRGAPPPVPRDLGARVSLALDDEMRRALRRRESRGRARGAQAHRRSGIRPAWAGGAFAGLAVAALVAVLVLPLGLLPGGAPATEPPGISPLPAATPITVDTQPVAWVRRTNDGRYVISSAEVDHVCAGPDASSCGTLDGGARTVAALDVKPSSIVLPRDGSPAVVVGGDAVYAISVDLDGPVTSPEPEPSQLPSSEPVKSPAATGALASPPADTPAPSVAPGSAEPASPEPTESVATPAPNPSPEPGTATPSLEPGTATPATDPTAEPATPTPASTPEPSSSTEPATPLPTLPPATPVPTAEAVRAIAEGVVIVGAPPAYSPDGAWVAFSARPRDGAHGPDVYAWRVGERRARAITDDHGSVFSGWLGDVILASTARLAETPEVDPGDAVPASDADPATVVARSFTIDPVGRTVRAIPHEGIWRPVVDPTDRLVVYWTGSLAWDAIARAWLPARGTLVATDWRALRDPAADLEQHPLPAAAAGPETSRFEVRFDPSGRHLAVWVADPEAPGTGRLALITITEKGALRELLLSDVAAQPGFSLDADRLAWSTPPGRNGVGSHVTVYAWRGEDAGQVYSLPDAGDEPLVVAH